MHLTWESCQPGCWFETLDLGILHMCTWESCQPGCWIGAWAAALYPQTLNPKPKTPKPKPQTQKPQKPQDPRNPKTYQKAHREAVFDSAICGERLSSADSGGGAAAVLQFWSQCWPVATSDAQRITASSLDASGNVKKKMLQGMSKRRCMNHDGLVFDLSPLPSVIAGGHRSTATPTSVLTSRYYRYSLTLANILVFPME